MLTNFRVDGVAPITVTDFLNFESKLTENLSIMVKETVRSFIPTPPPQTRFQLQRPQIYEGPGAKIRFPRSASIRNIFMLFLYGSAELQLPPFFSLKREHLETQSDYDVFIKAKVIINHIIDLMEAKEPLFRSATVADVNTLFNDVFNCFLESLSMVNSSRHHQIMITTLYNKYSAFRKSTS